MIDLTPEQEAELRRDWADKRVTRYAIAERLGICDQSVLAIAQRLDIGPKACRALKWPDEEVETLRRMIAAGHTYTEIGRAIHRPRSAVGDMVFRLGLANTRPVRQLLPKKAPAPKSTTRAPNTGGGRKVAAIRASMAPTPKPKPKPLPELRTFRCETAKPWLERQFGECAYPVSGEGANTLSCCAPSRGHTYCKAHREIMFVPAKDTPKAFVRGVSRWAA